MEDNNEAIASYILNKKANEKEISNLKCFIENSEGFIPEIFQSELQKFKSLNEYTLSREKSIGIILIPKISHCRNCKKKLILNRKAHTVAVYHSWKGTFLGSRSTKKCKECGILENYSYWTKDKERFYDCSILDEEYLLISEDTVIEVQMIKDYCSLLNSAALPFATYANAYNLKHGYKEITTNKHRKRSCKRKKG